MRRFLRRRSIVVEPSELLYFTSDPNEVPLVLPPWAREVPELAELIDAGYARRRKPNTRFGRVEDRRGRLRTSLTGDLVGPNPYEEGRL